MSALYHKVSKEDLLPSPLQQVDGTLTGRKKIQSLLAVNDFLVVTYPGAFKYCSESKIISNSSILNPLAAEHLAHNDSHKCYRIF